MPQLKASDLHISADMPPMIRINGVLKPMAKESLAPEKTKTMIAGMLTPDQLKRFQATRDLDFCYEIKGVGRYRANVLQQRKGFDAVFRFVPPEIPTKEQFRIPQKAYDLIDLHQGLVLVTGGTRSGKTSTLASMIEYVNQTRKAHILTIEDPIEYVFPEGKSLINQREITKHTKSAANALKAALRQDPDIIVIGEMRDLETIQLAISASETGHLVVSTLQTQGAHKTIDRVVDSYPAGQANQIRTMLSESLRGVISQQLIPRADGTGMVLAAEILISNLSLANLIRDAKTFQIPSILQTGKALGMKNMEAALMELVQENLITREEMIKRLPKKERRAGGEE
ncbi:MAG: PilT/PilU family type 4a pilus ATPase [Bdellovibrionales bacterium]|nr:PilT/PilU family type 4a pilus ATPase [Bdellovibrionales bacterium]